MMEFSPRFVYNVMDVFSRSDLTNSSARLDMNLSLDSNNVFRRNLVVEVNDDEVEIPVIARTHFENLVLRNMIHPTLRIKKIILPLYDNTPSQVRRTFDSIITQLFTKVGYNARLQKITTNKGEVYYGGKGIIFDENYTPLLLCTLTARSVHTEDNGNTMAYYRPVCHINPKVFLESDKLINKGIIKKLIPCYTSRDVYFPRSSYFRTNLEDRKVRVIIDNFDKFFVEPIKPTPATCSNDILNECLIDNIDDIMMLI